MVLPLLFCSSILFAGGKNPRYHGNGIWTSEPQDSGIGIYVIILVVFILAILFIFTMNFYEKHGKKIQALYKIITNGIPLLGIVIFIIWLIAKWFSKH